VVDGKVLSPGDLRRLHRYLIEVESISVISQMRTVVETEWPGRRTSCRRRIRQVDASHAPGGEYLTAAALGSVWRGLFSSSSLAARRGGCASSCAVIFDFDFRQSCNLEHDEFVVTGPDIRGASSLEPGADVLALPLPMNRCPVRPFGPANAPFRPPWSQVWARERLRRVLGPQSGPVILQADWQWW
jgi:hypothetical protein